jgi:hypothetical protein
MHLVKNRTKNKEYPDLQSKLSIIDDYPSSSSSIYYFVKFREYIYVNAKNRFMEKLQALESKWLDMS